MSAETTVANVQPEPQWAAWLAVAWADQKHHWKLVSASSPHTQQGYFNNTPEAIAGWGGPVCIPSSAVAPSRSDWSNPG